MSGERCDRIKALRRCPSPKGCAVDYRAGGRAISVDPSVPALNTVIFSPAIFWAQ